MPAAASSAARSRVVALDDDYEPDPCITNTLELIEKEKVFFLSNYVGTPTLTRALPVIKRYADQGWSSSGISPAPSLSGRRPMSSRSSISALRTARR